MARTFKGSTDNAGTAILGAPYWRTGKSVTGVYVRDWQSTVGPVMEFMVMTGAKKPEATILNGRVTEDGDASGQVQQLDRFSIGGMKGFGMALQDLENQGCKLQIRDTVKITCIGTVNTGKGDDMVRFELEVSR